MARTASPGFYVCAGAQSQVLAHAQQALNQLSHLPSPGNLRLWEAPDLPLRECIGSEPEGENDPMEPRAQQLGG